MVGNEVSGSPALADYPVGTVVVQWSGPHGPLEGVLIPQLLHPVLGLLLGV